MTTPAFADPSIDVAVPANDGADDTVAGAPEVLFVLNNLGEGSEHEIVRLANRLKDEGVHVSLACLNGPITMEQSVRRDVPLRRLDGTGKYSFSTLWRLREVLVRDRPASVFAVNLHQALYVALATLALRPRPRTVALVNTSTFRGPRFWKRIFQFVLARFDLTVHGSEAQRLFWFKNNRDAWKNSCIIYNGVDSNHFEPTVSFEAAKRLRASLGVRPDALLIGNVGRLAPENNQDVLFSTVRALRAARVDAHLALVGDGPMRAHLTRRAGELEIADRVHFIGEPEDVRPALGALDVFVLPSIAVEVFSNAALEAMAMGRPVILANIGGAREMVEDGVEGYVVSPAELAARLPAILAALYSDLRKRQQMGVAARARAVTCFSLPAMMAGYRGLLHRRETQ